MPRIPTSSANQRELGSVVSDIESTLKDYLVVKDCIRLNEALMDENPEAPLPRRTVGILHQWRVELLDKLREHSGKTLGEVVGL